MEIIRLEKAKEYCDKHNVERNDWVAGAIDKVLAGTHEVRYAIKSGGYKVIAIIDRNYINSHMQSLKEFDEAFDRLMNDGVLVPLEKLRLKQAMLTIGELADDWEIGK